MKKIAFVIELCLVIVIVGCISFGGTKPITKPVAKLESELETAKKDIDESKRQIEKVGGNVSTYEERMSIMENTLITVQNQLSIVQNDNRQYNESLKSIIWTLAGIWIAIKALSFVQMIVAAKVMPGKTIKNVFTMPWEKK
jgi:hypothetical protein